jgi:hypothetical protein
MSNDKPLFEETANYIKKSVDSIVRDESIFASNDINDETKAEFIIWSMKYAKEYKSMEEISKRMHIFSQNK